MKHLFLFIFFLWAAIPIRADSLATIGQTTKVINSSTSCDAKKWESSQLNSCTCCLVRENDRSSKSPDIATGSCIKSKNCTIKTLNQLAPEQQTAEDIMNVILWGALDTPSISVNPSYLDKRGKLQADKVADFLIGLNKNLRDLSPKMQSDFSKQKCIEVKDLGSSGGANTLQLFKVNVDRKCSTKPVSSPINPAPAYIIKETAKKASEIKNLRRLHQSILKKDYSLTSPNRLKNRLAIAFDESNIKYSFNGKEHYLSILTIAPGQSLMSLSKALGADIKKGDTAAEHRDSDHLFMACFSFGVGLGELHKRFMEKSNGTKLLGNSIIHGDLHLNNVFVDLLLDYLVILIDNETFALSLKEKRPVAIDLLIFYAFTVAHFKDTYLFPKEISLTKWNNVVLKPFLLGYISNWPPSNREQLLKEIKEILTNPTTALKLAGNRLIVFNLLKYQGKIKDINRVITEVSKY